MEELSFAFTLSREQEREKEAFVVWLIKNDHALVWLKYNGCDEDFMWKHGGELAG